MMFFVLIIIYVFIDSTSPNIITLNYNIPFKSKMNALAPQGWAFFTKDVNKDYFIIYRIKNKDVIPFQLKSAELSQSFGLKRDNRLINHKISTIIKNINSNLWYKYKGGVKNIPLNRLSKVSIKVKEPIIYGQYIIEFGNPMPYDWYRTDLKIRRTMDYIQLEIKK